MHLQLLVASMVHAVGFVLAISSCNYCQAGSSLESSHYVNHLLVDDSTLPRWIDPDWPNFLGIQWLPHPPRSSPYSGQCALNEPTRLPAGVSKFPAKFGHELRERQRLISRIHCHEQFNRGIAPR
ncbi:hypothetical protein C8R44DRAFT_755749 [Mycena epipterygia]|nr:hypothetical protein C8R44DRAFT_755749 [Mycena epipterygia]